MLIEWRPEARQALWQILDYIGARNLAAAEQLYNIIEDTIQTLPLFPYLYRPGRVPGTREAVIHPNYIVVYRVASAHIEIVTVLHARQKYPR